MDSNQYIVQQLHNIKAKLHRAKLVIHYAYNDKTHFVQIKPTKCEFNIKILNWHLGKLIVDLINNYPNDAEVIFIEKNSCCTMPVAYKIV